MSHTKEPWRLNELRPYEVWAETFVGEFHSKDDAARAVECVNALAGMNPAAVGECLESLKEAVGKCCLWHPEDQKRAKSALSKLKEATP